VSLWFSTVAGKHCSWTSAIGHFGELFGFPSFLGHFSMRLPTHLPCCFQNKYPVLAVVFLPGTPSEQQKRCYFIFVSRIMASLFFLPFFFFFCYRGGGMVLSYWSTLTSSPYLWLLFLLCGAGKLHTGNHNTSESKTSSYHHTRATNTPVGCGKCWVFDI